MADVVLVLRRLPSKDGAHVALGHVPGLGLGAKRLGLGAKLGKLGFGLRKRLHGSSLCGIHGQSWDHVR